MENKLYELAQADDPRVEVRYVKTFDFAIYGVLAKIDGRWGIKDAGGYGHVWFKPEQVERIDKTINWFPVVFLSDDLPF